MNLFSFSVEKEQKEQSISFKPFIRADLFALQKWQQRK